VGKDDERVDEDGHAGFLQPKDGGRIRKAVLYTGSNGVQLPLENDAAKARSLVAQHERLQNLWNGIRIKPPVKDAAEPFRVGQTFHVTAEVTLGKLRPDEVELQLYYGHLKSVEVMTSGQTQQMTVLKDMGDGHYLYACNITCRDSGRYGFTARSRPKGDDLIKFAPELITWA